MTDVQSLEHRPDSVDSSGGLSLTYVARILRQYAAPILLTIAAVAVGYVLLATLYILSRPVQRNTTLGFRLEFPGAEDGKYPNGLPFNSSDIVDSSVLRAAYDANQLERFMTFSDFTSSIVVLEANSALNELAREYEARLGNPKLSAVERDRLESEYAQKRESLRKNEWALTLTTRDGLTRVPPSASSKTLADILRLWADFSAKTRQVLVHRVPLIGGAALQRLSAETPDPLSSLLALRTASVELESNIENLSRLPGAEVVRSPKRNASLRDLELELAQVERTGIEFLISDVLRSGTIDRGRAAAMIESQLAFDRRELAAAEERVRVLRVAFEDYTRSTRQAAKAAAPAVSEPTAPPEESVVSAVSDSFIDRIVNLAQDAADRSYRQRQIDDIRMAALAAVPIRSAVAYQEQMLADVRSAGGAGGRIPPAQIAAERTRIAQKLGTIADDLTQVRGVLSRSLTASGQMYTVTSPVVSVADRSVSLQRLAVGGILLTVLAALAAIAAAFLHHRMQTERRQAESLAT
ncbi:MAG TPA: hypothetical protein VF911_03960 [Thermoanaerobaculia bacterium]